MPASVTGIFSGGQMGALPSTIRRGSKGALVGDLQRRLQLIGLYRCATCKVDSDFGPNTESAVKQFQSSVGIDPAGVVSDATWTELLKRTGAKPQELTPTNPFLGPQGQVNMPPQTGVVAFFTAAPLWQKALMVGGSLALGYLLVSWLTGGAALRGYERALNSAPAKCPKNVPPRDVPADAQIVEAA